MFSEIDKEHLEKVVRERQRLAESRGFTLDYQLQQEQKENVICHPRLAPATDEKYDRAVFNWAVWRLSRNESATTNFSKDEPDPSPQILKLFAEEFIVTRKRGLPSQKTACHNFTSFTSKWERETSRTLPRQVKDDVLNFIKDDLTKKWGLPTKPREVYLVTAKDIKYLLRRLFGDDPHDYVHERARVQTGSSLALFAGSGARAGAIVESSSYRNTNECLYYRWSKSAGRVKRWVTIDPEFLKGWRYRDDITLPKNWFREHPILAMNFVYWVMVHGIADDAFKGISSVDELLAQRPPEGRESWTLQWTDTAKDLPFFRMVTPSGPRSDKGLTFSSLRHHFTSLRERDGFQNQLRVHGIRGQVANRVDPKATEATRSQALDHQNHNTFLKYQAPLKALDMQAVMYDDVEPDYECRDMEQSMAHHRDPNVPLHLDAAAIIEFEHDEEVVALNRRISELTDQIGGEPDLHKSLAAERSRLYTKKARKLRAKRDAFVAQWWNSCYDEYLAGNRFSERDTTNVFDIYSKYIPVRARLRENLFKEATVDSEVGRQCLKDMVSLCKSTDRVVYYPGLAPMDGLCPVCSTPMSSLALQSRAKHILQCQRKSLNAAPYQQCYKNGKRAHRRVRRTFVQFCYLCAQLSYSEEDWIQHCSSHLANLEPRCGQLTFRYTLVAPGFCPFCLGDENKRADERFRQWLDKTTLLNHIDGHLSALQPSAMALCPHPCCSGKQYDGVVALRRHFFDVHSIEEPRSNCVRRKRRWAVGLQDPDNVQDTEQQRFTENLAEGAYDRDDVLQGRRSSDCCD
ncbi:hypothetical protein CNMCM6069_007995 [Aspergillus lentulus]|nr:hypothetical protein CNMCM6069_007995 [Aspergillus lentulus]